MVEVRPEVGVRDRIALVFVDREVTYGEFSARVGILARELIGLGVGPEVAVAICMDRSVEMMVAVHAVTAAGGRYVPLDPLAPAERMRYMLDTAQAHLVLVQAGRPATAIGDLPAGTAILEVSADGPVDETTGPVTDTERCSSLHEGNALYTLFTSGSTGRPKGVTVSHAAVANRLEWMREWYGLGADSVFVQKTPITFDVSVWELFLPFMLGARLVIAEPDRHGDPDYLADLIVRHGIDTVHFVPSMLAAFDDVLGDRLRTLVPLRQLFTSGEALPVGLAQSVLGRLDTVRLINLYGPTEAAVDVTAYEVRRGDTRVPIGVPVPNVTAVILDAALQMVPVGVPGELYLGGIQLARGYESRADLTAERFVADPFTSAGERLYRTGDLVRWNANGEIEYLGRTDFQVKLRGQRLELGEVEAVLAGVPGVVHAAATVATLAAGEQLVAYLSGDVDLDAVKGEAARRLPEYMRPTLWTVLDEMPLNSAGKADRRRLPAPELGEVEYVAPATPVEEAVAAVFAEVLGLDTVSVTESFFDLGGNSLAATRTAARISSALDATVSVRELFDAPSVRELSSTVVQGSGALAPIVPVDPRPELVPLSFAQQRMWFINQFEPGTGTYNIPAVLRIFGDLDLVALRAAVGDVVGRHEVLRTVFPAVDGVPVQVITPADGPLAETVWRVVDSQDELVEAVSSGFDLTVQWPLRVRVWADPADDRSYVLAVVVHHIAADGESLLPLVSDLVAAYVARREGRAAEFAPLPVQFADFAIWQHEELGSPSDPESLIGRQLDYWRQNLAGLPDVLDLPVDRPRPAIASHTGGVAEFGISAEVGERVIRVARSAGVTPFMVLHAGLAVLLARLSATGDIAVATPTAGRGQQVLDPLVGMFVNTLVLRTQVDPGMSFLDLLGVVRSVDLGAFAHADVPFEAVVDAVDPVRSEAFSPLAQVMLNFDPGASVADAAVSVAGLEIVPLAPPVTPAQLDVSVTVSSAPVGEDWGGSAIFASDLFDASTVESMMARFVRVLDALTADPSAAVGDVPMLVDGGAEYARVLRDSRGAPAPVRERTLFAGVVGQAAERPDAVAVVADGVSLTFAELMGRANGVARRLVDAGVGCDDVVVLALERSAEWIVGMVAAWQVGAAYAPTDPAGPVSRVHALVDDAGAAVLVATGEGIATIGDAGIPMVAIDEVDPIDGLSVGGPVVADDARLGYVITTSGSTGRPKPTMVPIGGIENTVDWYRRTVDLAPGDGVLIASSPTFDLTQKNVWASLASGATLYLADPVFDPADIVGIAAGADIALMNLAPSAFEAVVEADTAGVLAGLRMLFLGGEVIKLGPLRALLDGGLRLFNSYGPTEASDVVSCYEVSAADPGTVPIGGPIPGVDLYVLDSRLQLVPAGVPGELYVGGVAVGRGYGGMQAMTADRFVADPFSESGARLYRTGDLVRRSSEGELEYLGRTDFQVKLRGLRIELGEIESVLADVDGVDRAAVMVVSSDGGIEHLVAYLSPASVEVDQVRTVAGQVLPGYMVPSTWVVLDEIALNAAGKVDRRALPTPDFSTDAAEYIAPQTPAEELLCNVVGELLGVDRVSVATSFFDMGGNSLLAMRLAARAGDALGVEVSVRDVFEAPSVRELTAAVAGNTAARSPIVAVQPRPEWIPLAFAQQRIWFVNQIDPGSATYNIPVALRITGDLDVDALHAALVDVVARHEILRSTFPSKDGTPQQKIGRVSSVGAKLDWDVVDELDELREAVTTGFDVTKVWPIRARVWQADESEFVVAIVTHHIASDGESLAPLVIDMVTAYSARVDDRDPDFAPLQVQFADYALWQHDVLGDPADPESVAGKQLEYWRIALDGLPDLVELPTDRPRPAVASQRGAVVPFQIPAGLGARIDEYATATGATPFMVVHAALATLLARLSGVPDIAIGTPIAGRGQQVLDGLIGMFVNTLALRTRVDGQRSFADLVDAARRADLDAFANADVAFETVVDAVGGVRSQAFSPLTQVWLTFNQTDLPELAGENLAGGEVAGLTVAPVDTGEVSAKTDLVVAIGRADDGPWHGSLVYATDLFDEATVTLYARQLLTILTAGLDDPDVAVGDIALGAGAVRPRRTTAAQTGTTAKEIIESDAVVTGGPGADPITLGEIFTRAAAKWGPRQAVADADGRMLTYAQLDAESNRLARALLARGIGAGSLVAVSMPRSARLLTAIAAVAKAGAGYVPVDPDYPVDRRRAIFDDSRADLCLVEAASDGTVDGGIDTLSLDDPAVIAELESHSAEVVTDGDRPHPVRLDDIAYVIFTSGSTGRPKGVAVTHWGVHNFGRELVRRSGADEYTRMLGFASPSFDASILEYLVAVVSGGVIVYRPADAVGGAVLQEFLTRQGISHMFLTPTVLATLDPALVPTVRMVYVGGEAIGQALKDQWAQFRRIQNFYGPSEATVAVTASAPMAVGEPVTLGSALTGVGLMVLDTRLQPVPAGAVGELYVAGGALARGYLGRPGLTAAAFVANPFGRPGDLMYRTGDLMRWRTDADGTPILEYSGRADDQVKLRGLRIELGEIESVLTEHPAVHSAVVIGIGGSVATDLAAYLVPDGQAEIDVADVKEFADRRLPAYMVPAAVMVLDRLPLTPVGKLDKQALPEPVIVAGEYVAPQTPGEESLAAIFAEALGLDRVSATDSYFDLGGNSLSATRVAARAGEVLGVDVTLRDIFEAPSVRELAVAVIGREAGLAPVTAVDPRPAHIPLSFAQQRIWVLNRLDPESAAYNVPTVLKLTGDLDESALRAAFDDVVARHEILRTTFPESAGGGRQLIAPADQAGADLDWAHVDALDGIAEAAGRGFDLTTEYPLRVRLWRADAQTTVLAVVLHHIAADGESTGPLLRDLLTAYAARSAGTAPEFPPMPVQFADFALWQHQTLGSPDEPESVVGRQLDYWRSALAGLPDVLELPADRARPQVASYRGDAVSFTIPAEITERIVDVATEYDMTPFMVVHAALSVLLARLSATDDIAVATPIAGRGQRALDPVVGMFVNSLVLRAQVNPAAPFAELLEQVRAADLNAYDHAEVPFEVLVEALTPERSQAFEPLAQVMLSFNPSAALQGIDVDLGGLTIEAVERDEITAQRDLTVVVEPGDGDWHGTLTYATDLWDAPTMAKIAGTFVHLLGALTEDPKAAVGDAPLVAGTDREAVLQTAFGPAVDVPLATLAEAVAAQVLRTPNRTALWFEGREVTYREFAARVNVLARELIAAGVRSEDAVGVCLERGVEMVVAIHAVLAAGGQYVPIDPAAPLDRVRVMVATVGAEVVVAAAGYRPAALAGLPATVAVVEVDGTVDVDPQTPPVTDAERPVPLRTDNAAYTLFTSGSTGVPKGVTVSHRAIANRLAWGYGTFGWARRDRVVLKTPYTFDVSIPELVGPLISGATIVIARPGGHADPDYLIDLLERSAATSVHFVPSMLSVFLDVAEPDRLAGLASLRLLFASGEALPPAVVAKARAVLPAGVGIHNLFGPTEAAVEVSWSDVSGAPPTVTIGSPVWNTSLLVLDARLHPVPVGVPGELYIGGVQLARGYADRGDLTADRFVADPFGAPGARLYRTGDLVRRTDDGEVEYLGRTDFQIKLRGQRIELGEIESVLAGAPGVVKAAVSVVTAPGGGEHLAAFVSPATIDPAGVKAAVAEALPGYMVPTVWTLADDLVLNSAGKIDRRALPAADFASLVTEYVAPVGELEQQLAVTVAALLGMDRVSVTESFFTLGGDSIMSIQLASAMRAAGHALSPRQIFEHKTIRAIAAALAAEGESLPVLAEPAGGGAGDVVLPPVVAWMLEFSDSAADFADYSQSMVLSAPAGLAAPVLAEILDAVVAAHPMLSAALIQDETGAWHLTAGTGFVAAEAVTVIESGSPVGTAGFDDDLVRAHALAAGRLDPARGRLVQTAVVTDPAGAGRVVVVIHHLGVDAVSWRIIVEDLVVLWAQRSAGEPAQVRPVTVSERAWMHALASRVDDHRGEIAYWADRVPARTTDLGVRLDRARDRMRTMRSVGTLIDGRLTETLVTHVPQRFGGSVNDLLLAALARAVRSWQRARGIDDQAPVSVLVEGHGRYEEVLESGGQPVRADLSRSVGWFTTITPLRLDPAPDPVHAVKAAKEERLSQPDSGIWFGWLRYHADTGLAQRPLPPIVFNYFGAGSAGGQDVPDGEALAFSPAGGPGFGASPNGGMAAQALWTVTVQGVLVDGERKLSATVLYPESAFDDADVTDLLDRWAVELAAIAATGPDVGLSPSDVPGAEVTQADLDYLAQRFPDSLVWPLSPLQGGLYFQANLASQIPGAVDVYVAQGVLELAPGFDAERLHAAGQRLIDEHRVLRTGFVTVPSGAGVAVVAAAAELPWTEIDLGDDPSPETTRERVRAIADEQLRVSFDLTSPPLLRFVLVRHGDSASLVVTNHHLILDGWSTPLVMADVLALYATGTTFTSQTGGGAGDFGDYLRLIATRDAEAGRAAWSRVLAPVEGPTLAASSVAEATADAMPRDHEVILPGELVTELESVARAHGATPAMVLQFAWAVLLARLTGNQVVTFGETVSGRPADLAGVDSMIGLFINTLPAVVDVDPDQTIGEALEHLRADKVAVLDYQHMSLSEIAASVPQPVGFDTLVVHESYPVDAESLSSADASVPGGLTVTGVQGRDMTHYPLNMVTGRAGDGLFLRLKYLPAAFSDDQVRVFTASVVATLEAIAASPSSLVGDIPAGSVPDLAQVSRWTAGSERAVGDTIGTGGAGSPDAIALVVGDRAMSYAEFGARVAVLARELIAVGVGPDVAVAVCMDRSPELIVAIHAVLAAGGQYVPIDPEAPAERVAYMAETAGAGRILVAAGAPVPAGLEALPETVAVVEVDASAAVNPATPPVSEADRPVPVRPGHAAYTLFTSGSTGRPKGVTVSRRSLANLLAWFGTVVDDVADPVVLLKTPFTFDVSLPELFWPLMVGGRLVVAEPGGHRDPEYLREVIDRESVSVVQFVPSMLSVFLEVTGDDHSALASVRSVHVAGEALPPAVAQRVTAAMPQARVFNHYGPTEDAVYATSVEIVPGKPVTIGRPVDNTSAVVLDAHLRLVPAGIPGELYLAGVQLARGYAARGDLTADRFVAHPFGAPGDRLYRTGDLVRWTTGGEIEYLGRTDFQVKLRGQRLELGEIEAVLAAAPGVVKAAASVVRDPGGAEHLVAYLSPGTVDPAAVERAAAAALPSYMVPTVWTVLDDLAVNSAGKIDRRALPAPDLTRVDGEYVAPVGGRETAVAAAYAEVLGLDRVSVTASFFDLGGNSLSAMRLAARAGAVLGVSVGVRDLFVAPAVRALVELVAGRGAGLEPVTAVAPRPERLPLSFAQQRMWFINRFDAMSPAYNIPAVLRLRGRLDAHALRAAVVDVVERHEVLRTVFPSVDGEAVAVIGAPGTVADRLDWQVVDGQDAIIEAVQAGFDVTAQWPLRVRLWPVAEDDHVLAVVLHHIAADGESLRPLVTDLVVAYAARSAGTAPQFTPLAVQFTDYALWQRRVLGAADDPSSVLGRQLAFWTERLAGLPEVSALPTDRPRPPVASQRGARSSFTIDGELVGKIHDLAGAHGATPFMVFHAALATLLSRLSGSDDVAIGTSVAGRGQAELDPLVGMFVNTLVLRTEIDPSSSFDEVLESVRETDLEAFAHADLPFEVLVERLDPVRSEAFAPLTQVLLFFNERGVGAETVSELGDLSVEPVATPTGTARVDLTYEVSVGPRDEPWTVSVEYATDLFDAATVSRMGERLEAVLAGATARPAVAVGDLDLLLGEGVAAAENGRTVVLPDRTVADAVAAQIAATGDLVALRFGGREVTYAEFGARVNALARNLIAEGVGPETAVAVSIDRSVEMLVAVHAIVTAGGQYVPLDTSAPADRVAYMLDTAGVRVVLAAVGGTPAGVAGTRVIEVDCSSGIEGDSAPVTDAERLAPLRGDHAVYTLFTSGSTGRPKGVTLTHAALMNRLEWGLDELPIGREDVVLQKTPYTFDCSVPELFAPLTVGAELVVLKPGGHLEPLYVAGVIESTRATMVHFVPSMLSVFCEIVGHDRIAAMTSIRIVSTTGEALPPAVAAELRSALPAVLFYNLYGPTEAAVEITYEPIAAVDPEWSSVPIGVPVWNSSAVVLDGRLHRVPDGVAGELYLGGVQLARGYAARADLTAERFVADPAGHGERLYRTGDLVRRLPDGRLEYLGRTDFQVKLRGQRIELGEIEAALAAVPGVVHAAATVADGPGGSQHLVGYLAGSAALDVAAVADAVAAELPSYMVPTVWTVLDEIALNSAGKLDRKALPAPDFGSIATEFTEPAGPAEAALAEVFADILGLDRVSVTDSFFELGGNSLSAMRLAARAGAVLGVELSVREIFEAPTVRRLAGSADGRADGLEPITAVQPRPDRIPLSFAQQRMWFINRFDASSSAYNLPIVVRLSGPLDLEALRAAFADLVERHEILRTTFPLVDGEPVQVVTPAARADLDWALAQTREEFEEAVTRGFVLADEFGLRVRVWQAAPGEHVVGAVLHHIAADGESLRVFLTELVTAYVARAEGREPMLPALPVQFADYALWQHRVLGSPADPESVVGKQLAYWTEQLAGLPDVLELPSDRPRPPVASGRGAQAAFEIAPELADAVTALAATSGTTPFMVLHAALAVLLARLSNGDDIAIGTPVAGRGHAEIDGLIGMFVNTLVLRTAVHAEESFDQLLGRVRDVDLAAFSHGVTPFEAVVDAVHPNRSEAFAPLVQTWLSVRQSGGESASAAPPEIGELRVELVTNENQPVQVDLVIDVTVGPAGESWHGIARYATDLFDRATVERMTTWLTELLAALVAAPQAPVGAAQWLSERERATIDEWSHGLNLTPAPDAQTLAGLVLDRLTADPDAIAVITPETELTYRGLDRVVGVVARHLEALGVTTEVAVAIALPRSAAIVAAVHATVVTGGQFVPVDPAAPVDRLQYVFATAGVRVLVVDETIPAPVRLLAARLHIDVVELTEHEVIARADDPAAPLASVYFGESARGPADAAAYTIFTSGSTGRPKGVTVSHRSIVAEMRHDAVVHGYTARDVYAQVVASTFDPAVLDYYRPVVSGGSVLILDDAVARDPRALAEEIARRGVTSVIIVPSLLSAMFDILNDDELAEAACLRALDVGGEAFPAPLVDRILTVWPDCAPLNLYGPTESAIVATYKPLDVGGAVTIGRPVSHLTTWVLDSRMRPVPAGVPGELYLGGVQLARGYASRPDLTADRFVADPFSTGGRLYRTGDLVRWTADGELDYLGRTDFQVKLRGQRIELGEIEAALGRIDGVAAAAVTLQTSPDGGQYLAAYVAPAGLDVAVVEAQARAALASYMVPAVWTLLEEMPLSTAGKIDRAALPAPDPRAVVSEYVAPEGVRETVIARVFAEVLGIEEVSATASFFALGGNSLSAVRIVEGVRKALDAPVELAAVFADPTVRGLAAHLESEAAARNGVLLTLRADGALPPLFCVHPAGGLAWFYGGLAPYLPDRPIFGLQDPHVVAGEEIRTDAGELAERYLTEVRSVQPEGPYHLLGWSVGGVIAQEMATRLQAQGAEVAYLGVMDAAPVPQPQPADTRLAGDVVPEVDGAPGMNGATGMAEEAPPEPDGAVVADLLGGWRDLFDLGDDLQATSAEEVTEVVRGQIARMGLFAEDQVDRIMESFGAAESVVLGHEPSVYAGDLHLFVATADKEQPGLVAEAWSSYVDGAVVPREVDTHHLGMANPEALAVIGPELRAALDRADSER
ncbi:MAG: non-ribosomal peptide synthase/polyketide synthase [Gordonia sp. (in: high G+C Gram-positive bacteria)]